MVISSPSPVLTGLSMLSIFFFCFRIQSMQLLEAILKSQVLNA